MRLIQELNRWLKMYFLIPWIAPQRLWEKFKHIWVGINEFTKSYIISLLKYIITVTKKLIHLCYDPKLFVQFFLFENVWMLNVKICASIEYFFFFLLFRNKPVIVSYSHSMAVPRTNYNAMHFLKQLCIILLIELIPLFNYK